MTSKIAMASKGIPAASNTICMPDIEAVGMPGAPIEEIIAIKKMVMTIKVESSIPYK